MHVSLPREIDFNFIPMFEKAGFAVSKIEGVIHTCLQLPLSLSIPHLNREYPVHGVVIKIKIPTKDLKWVKIKSAEELKEPLQRIAESETMALYLQHFLAILQIGGSVSYYPKHDFREDFIVNLDDKLCAKDVDLGTVEFYTLLMPYVGVKFVFDSLRGVHSFTRFDYDRKLPAVPDREMSH